MTVVNETSGGYQKVETSGGRIVYKDPSGKFASQQAYAGSEGGEATARKYNIKRDPETGEIEGLEPDYPKGPTPEPNQRVTIAVKRDYDPKHVPGKGYGKDIDVSLEVSGVFPSRYDRGDVLDEFEDMTDTIREEIDWFSISDVNVRRNIEVADTEAKQSSFDGTVSFDQYTVNTYRIKNGEVDFNDKV